MPWYLRHYVNRTLDRNVEYKGSIGPVRVHLWRGAYSIHDIAISKPVARTRYYAELQSALSRMIERVILNGADPKPALDQAAAEYERAARA